jgi:hypothetical protein
MFLFYTDSTPAPDPTQVGNPAVKRPGCEADHSHIESRVKLAELDLSTLLPSSYYGADLSRRTAFPFYRIEFLPQHLIINCYPTIPLYVKKNSAVEKESLNLSHPHFQARACPLVNIIFVIISGFTVLARSHGEVQRCACKLCHVCPVSTCKNLSVLPQRIVGEFQHIPILFNIKQKQRALHEDLRASRT